MKLYELLNQLNSLPEEYKQLDIYENNEIWGLIELDDSKFDFEPKDACLVSGESYGVKFDHWVLSSIYLEKFIKEKKKIIVLYNAES